MNKHAAFARAFAPIALLSGTVRGQQAIPAGKGSYAEFPPAGISKDTTAILARTDLHVVDLGNRPVPTNKYWTHLLLQGKKTDLWTYPLKVVASVPDLKIFYPTTWGKGGNVVTEASLAITADDFNPTDAKAVDWGDWTLRFRLADGEKKIDVTVGEGMPYVWMECAGVSPKIGLGTKKDAATVTYFNDAGQPGAMPAYADHFGLQLAGRPYGIFAPDGTQFTSNGQTITTTFTSPNGFLIICPFPPPPIWLISTNMPMPYLVKARWRGNTILPPQKCPPPGLSLPIASKGPSTPSSRAGSPTTSATPPTISNSMARRIALRAAI